MATILAAKDDPAAALTWTERGLGIETSYDLRSKHRELLTVLGRHDEAIQHEWSHFTQVPTIYSYQTLMELVPGTARATWHDRAIEAAVQSGASLSVLLPLLVDTEETARLACVIDQCTDDHLSHAGYRTVEAAEALDESCPEQAARLWRALGLDIVNAGKSKQYAAAVEYFGRVQRCFAVAGLPDCWDELVDQVRANHYRKAGFIREFEKVVTGVTPEPGQASWRRPAPAGLRRNDFPVAPNAACRGAGIRDHGGMPDDELLERVRELRARGRSPKEIARALKVRPATVTPLIRRLAAAEPQEKEAPLIGCWVNQGWSSSVRFTGRPEWPDTGAGETGESGLVIVVVARERGSSVRVCEFLVDTWCLGVKNAWGRSRSRGGSSRRFVLMPSAVIRGHPWRCRWFSPSGWCSARSGTLAGSGSSRTRTSRRPRGISVSGTAYATWTSAGTGCPCTSKALMTTRGASCTRSARTSATATSTTWRDCGPDGTGIPIASGFRSANCLLMRSRTGTEAAPALLAERKK
jgi:hypothetical protein